MEERKRERERERERVAGGKSAEVVTFQWTESYSVVTTWISKTRRGEIGK